MSAILCDGCGLPASSEHIAHRLRRIELATRFRPIHIGILFLAEAPPSRLEDYFYYVNEDRSARAGLSQVLFESLLEGVGIDPQGKTDAARLAEFQKRGYFLADSLECPAKEIVSELRDRTAEANASDLAHRYGPTIIKRIQLSYKPKHVALLSTRTRHLIPLLQQAGLGQGLLLYRGLPLHFPHPHNPAAQAQFCAGLAELLATAAAWAKTASMTTP